MKDHHTRALHKAQERLLSQLPDLLAILVAGSIAKGIEQDKSDVDIIVVVKDDEFNLRLAENRISFVWPDVCDYEGGYVEGRFVSRSFLNEAVTRGSEPTRHSYTGVSPIYCIDPEIPALLPMIPVYPESRRDSKIESFLAQMFIQRCFWHEGHVREDVYQRSRAGVELALYGCRLVLAHNRQLFATHKRLIEQTLACPIKPSDLKTKIDRLLSATSPEPVVDYCETIEKFIGLGQPEDVSRFIIDVELTWYTNTFAIAEW